jgi:ATP-grasp domain-containing protein
MNVLVLSATASAINYQKALAERRDVTLYMSDASPYAGGLYGGNVMPVLVPRARELNRYRDALDELIRRHAINVLLPTSDHDVEGVMELCQRGWSPPVAMFRPDYEVYRTFSHKARLMEALRARHLACLAVYSRPEDVEYPAVVKPARECGSKGVWIVHNPHELHDRLLAVRKSFQGDVVLQQYIPGSTGSIHIVLQLYGQDGQLYGEVASRSHMTAMTWGGGGLAGAIVDEPELLDQARRIVAALGGWRGPINLEFKRHQHTGRFYLLEVNCRINGYSYLYTMNGLNFPSAILDLLSIGKTEFLAASAALPLRNFVIGYRELPVDNWVAGAA